MGNNDLTPPCTGGEEIDGKKDGRHARSDRSRAAILQAAVELWAEAETPFDVSAMAIADRAGVSRRNVFRNWPSLRLLWLEARPSIEAATDGGADVP